MIAWLVFYHIISNQSFVWLHRGLGLTRPIDVGHNRQR